jgi:hypothetical protein
VNIRADRRRFLYESAAAIACALTAAAASNGQSANDKRRAQLATVHRVAVAPPFYGTGRLAKPDAAPAGAGSKPDAAATQSPANARIAEYLDRLRKLQDHTRTLVPERLAARTPYQIVPMEETEAALKALDLTPEKLYLNAAKMKGTKFSGPDPEAVRKLAARLHADAVVLDTLDEPRKSPERLFFDPLGGLGLSEAHVTAKIGFWVLLADGTEVFQRVSDVVHPVTKIGNREFLFVDWQEANDLAIENFLDELTRFTPEKQPAGK